MRQVQLWKAYIKNKIPKDGVIRAVALLTGSNIAVQILYLGALPIISRIYSPSDFGVLAIFSAIVQTVTAIACLRYEIPIPNCDSDNKALHLLVISGINILAITFCTLIVIVTVDAMEFDSDWVRNLGSYIWAIPFCIAVCGAFNALQFYAVREKAYQLIAKTRVKQTVAGVFTQITIGLIWSGPSGLIIGLILQTGAGGLSFLTHLLSNRKYDKNSVNFSDIKEGYKTNSAYLKYSTPEALLQMGALQLPLLIIGALISPVEAGFLFLANRIMQLPVAIISGSFAQTFSANAPAAYRENGLEALFLQSISLLIKYAVGPTIFVGIASWALFPYVFGTNWSRAGEIAMWLIGSVGLQVLSSATGAVLYITARERTAFVIHLAGFLIRVIPTYFVALYMPETASYAYAITGAFHYLIYFLVVFIVCGASIGDLLKVLRNTFQVLLLWSASALVVVFLCRYL